MESDVVIPDILDEVEIGEKFYDYALPWEKIKNSDFNKLDEVGPFVKKLTEASAARVLTDEIFKQVREDVKTYKEKILERSRFSLKEKTEKEKLAEKEKLEARVGYAKPTDSEAADENEDVPLLDDAQLQESLRIAADYVVLKTGGSLLSSTIPEVDAAAKARWNQFLELVRIPSPSRQPPFTRYHLRNADIVSRSDIKNLRSVF